MALVVEDGTGLATANSYATVATADAYHALRGNSTWVGISTEKEVRTFTVTAACSANGNLTVTLNSVAFVVAITTASDTTAKVATVLRAATYTGWVVTGADSAAIFTATVATTRAGTYTLGVAATGVTGTIAQTQAGSDATKEAALIRASFALDGMYGSKWPGYKSYSTQALDWPRDQAYDIDGYDLDSVPAGVVNALYEAALLELTTAGVLTTSLDRGGAIQQEVVGPLSTTYFSGASTTTKYRVVSQYLARIIPTNGKLIRG